MTDQPDPVEGSPMMTALVDSAQMQAARFAAGGDLSGVLASTSLASSLQGIPATGSIPLHQVASNTAAIDFNSPLPLQQSRGVYSTPSGLDPQNIVSVLREQSRLPEELDAIAVLGDVTADPQSLRFNYSADSPVSRPSRQKKANFVYREQDRFVPINNVSRVMRKAIPRNGKVSKDAKECMQECVSEFISFLTSEASDRCIDEKRKTITGDDILFALSTLGFDNYVHPLQSYLKKYREYLKEDKQHGASRHDEDEVAENGDHHTSAALPSSDDQLTTTSTATQHDMPT